MLSVRKEDYLRLSMHKYTISDVCNDDAVTQKVDERFRKEWSKYETGIVHIGSEMSKIDRRM